MNRYVAKQIPLAVFLIVYVLFFLLTFRSYGISFDERDVYSRGRMLYEKIRGNDPVLQKDFVISSTKNGMAYYNNFYGAVLYAINGSEDFGVYHLLNILFGALAFVAIYELILLQTGKGNQAILGPIFLLLTPRFFGDLPSNPKDMPFAVYYLVSLLLIFVFEKYKSLPAWMDKIKLLVLGVSFGLTASQRIIGYTVYLVYLLYRLFTLKGSEKKLAVSLINMAVDLLVVFVIGYFVHMVTLPILGADPFNNFIGLLNQTKSFPWGGSVFIFGREFAEKDIPRYYMPLWIAITTPLFILLLCFISLFTAKIHNRLFLLVVLSLCINLALFVALKPVVYDGVRHGLFLLPQLVVLAVMGFSNAITSKKKIFKYTVIIVTSINAVLVAFNYFSMHPYEVVYFNEFINPSKNNRNYFETDYWGLSSKEAAEWIGAHVKSSALQGKTIAVNGNVYAFDVYAKKLGLPISVVSYDKDKKYDYVVCWDRWNGCLSVKGNLIGTVSRRGLILNSIYQTN